MGKTYKKTNLRKKTNSRKKSNLRKKTNSRNNIKRVSLRKMKKAHGRTKALHYSRGKHKATRSRYGGTGCMCGGKIMKGGMVSSPASGPVGFSWDGGKIETWPGAASSQGLDTNGSTMSNHFPVSENGIAVGGVSIARSSSDDFIVKPKMNGGRKRYNKKSQKGGFFQEMVNLGRGAVYNIQGKYHGLVGQNQPISENPFPTEKHPIDNDVKIIRSPVPNVGKMFEDANNSTSRL